jgi:integrase
VYYIEFVEKNDGVPQRQFQEVVRMSNERWAAAHPGEELVMIIGRTWRMGPKPGYMVVWRIKDFTTFETWNAEFQKQHILDGLGRRAQKPSAARHFLTTMRRMFVWAVAQKILHADPTEGIKTPKPAKTEGFVTWSDADVRRYYKRWPLGTRERIMIDVYLFTGFRRGDAASFGPADVTEHVQERIGPDGRIKKVTVPIITKRLEKGDETIEVTFPMLDVLRRTLEAGPIGTETYIATRYGKPMTKESVGNLFKEKCVAAGLTNRSAHGLRKAAATENGATEAELDAIFGWTDRRMASHYTKKANRKKLAHGGVAKLERMTEPMDHSANIYSLTDKLGTGNRAKSSIESDGGLKDGGVRSQIRTGLGPNIP